MYSDAKEIFIENEMKIHQIGMEDGVKEIREELCNLLGTTPEKGFSDTGIMIQTIHAGAYICKEALQMKHLPKDKLTNIYVYFTAPLIAELKSSGLNDDDVVKSRLFDPDFESVATFIDCSILESTIDKNSISKLKESIETLRIAEK